MRGLVLASHLSEAELFERYRSASSGVERSHYQIIWLLAGGKTIAECSAATGYTQRWISKLVHRYNAGGPASLGDRRRHNGGGGSLLSAEQLVELAETVSKRPSDGGLWTGAKVGAWIRGADGTREGFGEAGLDLPAAAGDDLADATTDACAGGDGGRAGGL